MKNFIICLMAFICLPAFVSAQGIKGKVVDESGLPLPGVSVSLVGTTTGTVSDIDGNFSVKAKAGDQLQFSFVGYTTQTVSAADGMTVNMQLSATELKDVVVQIGYGSASKRDLTGSIVKISGSEIADKPNANPLASLQGRVAGLSVVNNGQPGSEPDIRIRGTVSRFNTKPLYVIDGIWNDNMSFVNPNDIESVEILKDPSSLAVFGSKGANGVIIVTTKRAKAGKTTVTFNTSAGIKSITGKPEMTNASQFQSLFNQGLAQQGAAPYDFSLYIGNTDWVDAIKQDSPIISQYNLSISNATETNKVYLGVGYLQEEGLIRNELYKKFTFNFNDELKIGDRIKVGGAMNGYDARNPQLHDFIGALNATPVVEAFNQDQGLYNQLPNAIGGPQIGNPLADVEIMRNGTQLSRDTRFVGSLFAEVQLIDGLSLRGSYLGDLWFNRNRGYTPVFNVWAADALVTPTEDLRITPYSGNTLTSVNQAKTDYQKLQQDVNLTYKKSFGKHDVTALFGYMRYEEILSSMSGKVTQEPGGDPIPNDPRWWWLNVFPTGSQDEDNRTVSSEQWDRATVSYLGRVLYNYDGKYIFNASFRRDGSSELRKWQNFWAAGIAWDMSKEAFMQGSKLNYLKVKASTGQLGNQFPSIHYPGYPNYVPGASAVFGEQLVPAYILAFQNNPNLQWEVVSSLEGGVELATFNNRLSFEANYYTKKTTNLINPVSGTDDYYINAGSIENRGIELMASWRDKVGDIEYSLSGNLTTMKNEVTEVYNPNNLPNYYVTDDMTIFKEGSPIGSFYGYVVDGVYQSVADLLDSPPNSLGGGVGDLKFKDVNGDGSITDADRTVIGNPTPDFTYGISASVNWKGFSLSADFQGVYGNEIWRAWGNGATYAPFNYRSDRLNAWNGPGTSNWEPRVNPDAAGYNTLPSTYMIEDGSYFRVRNIQIGYTFDSKVLDKLKISGLKIYLNAQNPFTWKNNSGFSPEAGGSPTKFSIDSGGYPVPSITTLGINASF